MTEDNDKNNPIDYESLCSALEKLDTEDIVDELISTTSIDNSVRLLINVLCFDNSYKLKTRVVTKLKSILDSWDVNDDFSGALINTFLIRTSQQFLKETNDKHRGELLSISISLIKVANKYKLGQWETIADFLARSRLAESHLNLTEMISQYVAELPSLFGQDIQERSEQIKKLLLKCLDEFELKSKRPLSLRNIVKFHLWGHQYYMNKKSFAGVAPLLLLYMETNIVCGEKSEFMNPFMNILITYKEIFIQYCKNIFKSLIGLLKNTDVNKRNLFKVSRWVVYFVRRYTSVIEDSLSQEIPDILECLVTLELQSYPNYPTEWFTEYSRRTESRLLEDVNETSSLINDISFSLNSKAFYEIITKKFENLLKCSDWQSVVTGIDLMRIMVCTCHDVVMLSPYKLLKRITPYLSNDNPLIVSATLQMIVDLCEIFINREYVNLHKRSLSLIIDCTEKTNSIYVKVKAMSSVGNLGKEWSLHGAELNTKNLIQIYIDIFDAYSKTTNADSLNSFVNLIADNYYQLNSILGEKFDPYIPKMITKLFEMYDKLALKPEFHYSSHRVIDCIIETLNQNREVDHEIVVGLFVDYLDNFSVLHSLSPDDIEIPICFFTILFFLLEKKVEGFAPLVPKLAACIDKGLKQINEVVLIIKGGGENIIEKNLSPFGCIDCLQDDNDLGVDLICSIASKLLTYHNDQFGYYTEKCLKTVNEILHNIKWGVLYTDVTEALHKLLYAITLHGDARVDLAKKYWNDSFKSKILSIMQTASSTVTCEVFGGFAKCITIPNFNANLNSDDMKTIGEILNKVILDVFKTYEESKKSNIPIADQSLMAKSCERKYHRVKIVLFLLHDAVMDILYFHKIKMAEAVMPMLRSLLFYQESDYEQIFTLLICSVVDHILTWDLKTDIGFQELLGPVLDISVGVLSRYSDYELFVFAVDITRKIKERYLQKYEEYILSQSDLVRNHVEETLSKRLVRP